MGSVVAIVFVSSAAMRGGAQSWAARTRSCSSVRLPGVGVFALVGSGCAVRSRRLARVRASGLVASLRDEAVAGVVIVCPCHSTTLRFPYKCEALWRSDTPTMAAISGAKLIQRAFCGDASSRNEKSGNLASCLLAGGVLFRPLAIRYDVFPGHRGATRRAVRKHRAPKGALRRHRLSGNN